MKKIEIKKCVIGEGLPKICVPLVGKTEEDIAGQAQKICDCKSRIDIVEFRADYYEGLQDIPRLLAFLEKLYAMLGDKVLLFTIRSESEGGEKLKLKTPDVYDINRAVIESTIPDMVDVELYSGDEDVDKLVKLAHEKGIYIVMSNHDFNKTPEVQDMVSRMCRMQDMGADIAKIAVMPQNNEQLINLFTATSIMNTKYARVPVITISMGKLGALSRIAGQVFGSSVTFAALEQSSAPGQIPVDELDEMMTKIDKYCN